VADAASSDSRRRSTSRRRSSSHAGPAGGYGLVVDVEGDDGAVVRYAHASAVHVAVGDRVAIGDELAAVGSTGRSTGPHLHLEVRKNGEAVDPTTALLAAGAQRPR
jgi:murein DD-endopeptidase MepM/ murein hydrolase activator NlpD